MRYLRSSVAVPAAMSLLAALTPAVAAGAVPAITAPPAEARAGAAPDLSKYTGQKLNWTKCTFDTAGVPTLCAMMTVPRDWANPAAKKDLKVYVSKVATTKQSTYQGVLMTNPGGPGGQGASLASLIAGDQPAVRGAYTVLGMDPRGTGQEGAKGAAGLGLTCDIPVERFPTGPLDARDRSTKSIRDHQQIARVIAEACQSNANAPYITTWQTAHDMDLYRQLVKGSKLSYVGYSYGTWLGAKYASLFPKTTGRMILDSNVDWQGRLQADFEDFPRMGQRHADKVYLPWLTRQFPEVFGRTVTQAKAAIEKGRRNAPKLGFSPDDYDALLTGNGNAFGWLITALVLTIVISGDDATAQRRLAAVRPAMRAQLDAVSRKRFGVPVTKLTKKIVAAKRLGVAAVEPDYVQAPLTRFAVACNDQPTKSTRWYKELSDRQGPKYPYFGWQYGLTEVCGPWTDAPRQVLPTLPASVRKNMLVVQGEFDPQTSYEQAMAAVRKAPGVNVLRVDDDPFHGLFVSGNPCVDGVVTTYLVYGSTTPNSICPALPLPFEEKVYPVRGPVDEYLAGHKLRMPRATQAKPADSELRRRLVDLIAEANKVVKY